MGEDETTYHCIDIALSFDPSPLGTRRNALAHHVADFLLVRRIEQALLTYRHGFSENRVKGYRRLLLVRVYMTIDYRISVGSGSEREVTNGHWTFSPPY